MKKKFYKYGLFYIGVVLAACADNADLNEPTGSTTPPSQAVSYTHLDAYIEKPFSVGYLQACIAILLNSRAKLR